MVIFKGVITGEPNTWNGQRSIWDLYIAGAIMISLLVVADIPLIRINTTMK